MSHHEKYKIHYIGRGGNTEYQALCRCGSGHFGYDWPTAEECIEAHVKTSNDTLFMSVANELYHITTPGHGHVANQDGNVTDQYLALAEYVTRRGFDTAA